jgi:hypothetical protein
MSCSCRKYAAWSRARRNGDKDIRASHFLATGRLNVERGTPHDPLEAIGGLSLPAVDHEVFKFGVKVLTTVLRSASRSTPHAHRTAAASTSSISASSRCSRVAYLTALVGGRRGSTKGLFERAGENWHQAPFALFHYALQRVLFCVRDPSLATP